MLAQAAEDRLTIGAHRRHVLEILRGEAAAQIHHGQVNAALGEILEDHRGGLQRAVPHAGVTLLRADVEGHAIGLEPKLMGAIQHARRHLGHAAELARQGPFGARAVAQDAAEHLGAGRDAGDLLDLFHAIDRIEADAELIGPGDVALFLDGVAEGDAIRRAAGRQHLLDLDHGSRVEAGAQTRQQIQHLRRGIGLHGVEHARVGQGLGEGAVIVAHDIEVEDHAWPFIKTLFTAGAEKLLNTVSHRGIPSTHAALAHAFTVASWMTMPCAARGGDASATGEPPAMTVCSEPSKASEHPAG